MKNLLTFITTLALAGCAQLVTVKEVKPQLSGYKVVASTDLRVTLDHTIGAAERAWHQLERNPADAVVVAINDVPISPGIPYHTIAGDRGKGDSPNSSDGVVPYWSSHQNGAKSELIVPSNHGAHQTKEAIAEVDRILKVNLGKSR